MALLANGLFLLLFGGVEIGRYCFVSESVHYLVGEVARAAVINPDGAFGEPEKAEFVRRASILDKNRLDLAVNINRQRAPAMSTVRVTARYEHFKPGDRNVAGTEWSSFFRPIDAAVTLQFVAP